MPIYEFLCERCNTVYKFLSRKINTDGVPQCPSCGNGNLIRQVSLFSAVSGGQQKEETDEAMPPVDEAKMERAISMLAREADGISEDDPRQAAALMRKLSDATGLRMGAGMEEALSRLERGEDPEKIEEEMGDIFEGEDPFTFEKKSAKTGKKSRPRIDDRLYEF